MILWLVLLLILVYLIYKWIASPSDYFSKRNIPHAKWFPFIGSMKVFLQKHSFPDMISKQYAKYKDYKFFGFYAIRTPVLIVKDLDIVRQILVEKFEHFANHQTLSNTDPVLDEMIQVLEDGKWKRMRATLMPAFTPEKIRLMFYLIEEYCEIMMKHLNEKIDPNGSIEIDIKDIFTRFSNDVIAAIAFGIKVDSLSDPKNELFQKGREAVKFSKRTLFMIFIFASFEKLISFFKIKMFSQKFTKYFKALVLETIKYRSENDIRRFDMIQLLMESSRDYYQKKSEEKVPKFFSIANTIKSHQALKQNKYSDNQIVAQCLSIFISGFTYTSQLLIYASIELARNPEIQDRLQKEIDRIKEQLNGKSVTCEALNSMKYLDMILCETLRKLPASVVIDRVCTKPYTITDHSTVLSIDLKPGDVIWIPVQALHFDPEYFPDPDKFDPERFSNENRGYIKPYSYIPFGAGPRSCFCSKFSLMQCKAVLFNLLSKYCFEEFISTELDKLYQAFIFSPELSYRIRFILRK